MSGDFDWSDMDSIAITEQLATAVYENLRGDIVIRQQDPTDDDDDWVIVAKGNVPALCRALMAAAGLEPQQSVALLPSPKSSGADRSRRYRERHAKRGVGDAERDGAGVTPRDTGVTDRDAERVTRDGELTLGIAAE